MSALQVKLEYLKASSKLQLGIKKFTLMVHIYNSAEETFFSGIFSPLSFQHYFNLDIFNNLKCHLDPKILNQSTTHSKERFGKERRATYFPFHLDQTIVFKNYSIKTI